PRARLPGLGALRLLAGDAVMPLADRPVKVADRLAAFVLGAGRGLLEAGAPLPLRHVLPPPDHAGRPAAVREVAQALAAETRLPLLICGPDAPAVVAAA